MVLNGIVSQCLNLPKHFFLIVAVDLIGHDFQSLSALQIDEFGGLVCVAEIYLMGCFVGVKEYDFVLAMFQMSEGVHQSVLLFFAYKSVGENDYQRPFVQALGSKVQTFRYCGGMRSVGIERLVVEFSVKQLHDALLMGKVAVGVGLQVNLLSK